MKFITCCIALALLAGCATTPPPPPGCSGEFRPINPVEQRGAVIVGAAQSIAFCAGAKHGQS